MNFTLKVWRQDSKSTSGQFSTYSVKEVSPDSSFLEMLDVLNEQLTETDQEPVAFDSDCREGVCGMCSMVIDGQAHGPLPGTVCQL